MVADLTQQGIAALHMGDRYQARRLLNEAVQMHPEDVAAWRALADTVESTVERRVCLEHVLALQPDDAAARRELEQMGPPPSPEPSPDQIVCAAKHVVSAQPEHVVGRLQRLWLHKSS